MAQSNLIGCCILVPQTDEWLSGPSLLPKRFVTTSEPQAERIVSEDLCSTSAPDVLQEDDVELIEDIETGL